MVADIQPTSYEHASIFHAADALTLPRPAARLEVLEKDVLRNRV
jgi:hypothetical protein